MPDAARNQKGGNMKYPFRFGLKAPTSDWFWKYGLSYDEAIEKLKYMGVDFLMCHNRRLPGADTAVPGGIAKEYAHKFEHYDESVFREKLRAAGIAYIGQGGYGFNERLMERFGNYPVDQSGKRMEKTDWYIGACPTCGEYTDAVLANIELAMLDYDMDGVFIGFMRYPGFWELWLPGTDGEAWAEYCFCERCIHKFTEYSGIEILAGGSLAPGQWIRANCRDKWTEFKCGVIHGIVARYREIIKRYNPDGIVMLNTIPFDPAHFGDYGKMLFGQSPAMLSGVVDVFEVMGYHQILGLPYQWIGEAGNYFKKASGGKTVCCTAQGKALYTDGMHAGAGRADAVTNEEFKNALRAIRDSDADGAIVFTWSDFLSKEYEEHDTATLDMVHEMFAD